MFKSLKRRGEKVKEKVDFKFAFSATKVPLSGWEKLVVTVIPVETGRLSYKTTRATVKNGVCQWQDATIESTKLVQDTKTKEYEEKFYKFIVSTGSSRSGVLGDVTVNVADYAVSNNSTKIDLPLKNCNSGTILHATITCLTPRTNSGRELDKSRASDRSDVALEDDEGLSVTDDEELEDSDNSGNFTTSSATSNTSAPISSKSNSQLKANNGSGNRLQRDIPTRHSSDSLDASTPRLATQNGSGRALTAGDAHSPTSSMNSSGRQERERDRDRGVNKTVSSQDSFNSTTPLPPAYSKSPINPNGPHPGAVPFSARSNNERDWGSQRSRGASENGYRVNSQTDLGGREALEADLAAAETTIEELRMDTVSTQRQNRKLNIEIETLKQQLNSHVRKEAESGMEMNTLVAERDRLKQELEQARSSMMALEERETGEGNARWKVEDAQNTIRELQDEIHIQKDENNNLNLLLRKTQDSNMDLMLGIKELEETLEQHRKEAEQLTVSSNDLEKHLDSKEQDSIAKIEQQWKQKVAALEEEKRILKAQVVSHGVYSSPKIGDELHIKSLETMVERLTTDVEELENEAKELANENVELHAKLDSAKRKESEVIPGSVPQDNGELTKLRSLVTELERKLSASKGVEENYLILSKGHVGDVQNLVEELRAENVLLVNRLKNAEDEAHSGSVELEAVKSELARLHFEREELKGDLKTRLGGDLERSLTEAREAFAAQEQELRVIEETSSRAEEEHSIALDKIAGLEDDIRRLKEEMRNIVDAKARTESIVAQLQSEKAEMEERLKGTSEYGEVAYQMQGRETEVAHANKQIAAHVATIRELEASAQELKSVKAGLETTLQDSLEGERLGKSQIEELEFQLSILSEEMGSVKVSRRQLEEHVGQLEREKEELEIERKQLELKLQTGEAEANLRHDHVELLQAELVTLRAQMDTLSTSRKNLERRASELESTKDDLESQFTDMEEENIKLTERIRGLELQLRNVTEERESYKSEKGMLETRLVDHQGEKSKSEVALHAATKEHQNKVSQLEAKLAAFVEEREENVIAQQELQRQIEKLEQEALAYVDTSRGLKEQISHLEKIQAGLEANLLDVSENYSVASKTISSLEGEMLLLRTENEEKSGKFLAEIETMKQTNGEAEQRANRGEETLRRIRWEKAAAIERMQTELQRLTEQMSSSHDEKEKMASQALLEASELRAEKGEWEERFRQMEAKVRQADEQCTLLKADYGSRMQELIIQNEATKTREQDIVFKLTEIQRECGDLKAKEILSRGRCDEAERKLALVMDEKTRMERELDELQMRVQDAEMLGVELQRIQGALDRVKTERDNLDTSSKNINMLNEFLQEEKRNLEEDLTAWQQENEELKHAKIALEEKVNRLQLEIETQGASRLQDVEQRSESIKLKRQNTEFKRKLTEQEEEKEEFRKKVELLEGELQEKVEALGNVERKLREKDYEESGRSISNGGSPSYLQRSLSRSNSKINGMAGSPSREAKELSDLRERVKLLEGDIKSKAMALDALKRDFSAKESILYNKIELLEMANEQLIQGGPDLGIDQLQMELTRLQNLNAVLARRERELVSQLSTQEVLHKEVQRLQEENEQIETRFMRFKETAKFGNLMDRVVSLETELAEALEANSMYKLQLRNAFAKQQNVQAAALQNYGDVDQVITDLVRLKGHSSKLEGDVKDLRERYATMSLRYAEVESQREELVMTVRNLVRDGKKA